jgi:Tfp pilus assembly protein PilF
VQVPTPEQRQAAAQQFLDATRWLVARQPQNAVSLLRDCCCLDPASMVYRQALRKVQRQLSPARGPIGLIKRWRAVRTLQSAVQSRNWLKVLDLAEAVLALDPANELAHLALAAAFEALDLLDHAVWVLEQACVGSIPAGALVIELTRLYERTGKFSQVQGLAEAIQQRAWEIPPKSWQSQDQAELDAFRQDAALAEQKLAADPENKDLPAILSRLRHEVQAREIGLCRQQAEHHPGDLNLRLELGVLLLKAGQFEAAVDTLETARAADPLAWRPTLYAAYCFLNLRQWRQAEPLFKEALALMPVEADATRKEVLLLLAQNQKQSER